MGTKCYLVNVKTYPAYVTDEFINTVYDSCEELMIVTKTTAVSPFPLTIIEKQRPPNRG